MLEFKEGLILYHGSYCEVKKPDLCKCAKRKDFIECLKFVEGVKICLE